MTILRWACSHVSNHTHSSTLPHATDDTHSSTPPAIISLLKDLPMTLTFVREERQLKQDLEDRAHVPASERWDWGMLVSHCTSSYWECLLTYLKYASFSPPPLPPPLVGDRRLAVGSSDVIGVAECCISSLDVAALSLGVVIDALSTLIPKVC